MLLLSHSTSSIDRASFELSIPYIPFVLRNQHSEPLLPYSDPEGLHDHTGRSPTHSIDSNIHRATIFEYFHRGILYQISSFVSLCFFVAVKMQLSSILLFTTLALAMQSPLDGRPECVSQLWEVHNLTIFTANPASSLGSFLYFSFIDPNFNMRSAPATCGFRLEVGTEGEKNSLLGYDYVKCAGGDGNDTSFRYNGDNITVARTGVRCGR